MIAGRQLQKEHKLLLLLVDEEAVILNKSWIGVRFPKPISGTKCRQMRIVRRRGIGDRAAATHVCMAQEIRKYLQFIRH